MKRIAAGFLAGITLTIITWTMPFGGILETYAQTTYNEIAAENITEKIDEYVEPYLGTDTLNNYENGRAVQCHAFVNYVWKNVFGYDIYSSKCTTTEKSSDYEELGEYINEFARPGDILRVDGKHSMVITAFDENSVSGYDWLYNKKERACTYTWEGVKEWGDGTQTYWLYQINDDVYNAFGTSDENPNRGEIDRTAPLYGSIAVQINNPVMTNNGQYQNIDSAGTTPIILNGRTVLPVRSIIEAMGGQVVWNDAIRTATITYKEKTISLTIDSSTMLVDGMPIEMDVAPVIYNDRTFLPIRPIMESLNGQVKWYDTIQVVAITYEK
ncbi:copper amine oxidase N-terminal domain-containing protein [Clostridium aminobutyricum]|uniref:Copper amine oxidase N-terminal domain-containing protein n=1 Tax=Clostridium aminobutyricum TaxID=33953 RepID=A0A939D8P8_CLOAM|nr:copper amine oxidase N-terminal domain-containing protein [Clostridium aminobutyricum]MBN7773175.1 copper amine oxidase N-terminal domain-containing protein [Clostridium aminobutyricum]